MLIALKISIWHAKTMKITCKKYANIAYKKYVDSMREICKQHAKNMQIACKKYVEKTCKEICKIYANSMQEICKEYERNMHIACKKYANSMQGIWKYNAKNMQTTREKIRLTCKKIENNIHVI